MKKLGFLLASAILTLTACGNNDEDDPVNYEENYYETNNHDIEYEYENIEGDYVSEVTSISWPQRGTWNENIYTNDYLSIRFEMPEIWDKFSDEQIAHQIGIGIGFLEGEDAIEATMEEIGTNSFLEMMATNAETGASINIAFERLENPYMTADEFISHASEELIAADMEVFLGGFPNVILGDSSWTVYSSVADFGISIYGRFLVNVYGGFVRVITIVYTEDSETPEEILTMFSEIF
jgi:hypothetical protein